MGNFKLGMDLGSIAGGIMGLIGMPIQHEYNKEIMELEQQYAEKNAKQQQDWTQENMHLQGDINNKLAIEAHNRNLEMYEKTQSTQAKVRELEQAGLSVGMLQGTPSQGGASSGGTASVSGAPGAAIQTPKMNGLDIVGAMSNLGLTIAQIQKMKAETKNIETQGKIQQHQEYITRLEKIAKERQWENDTIDFIVKHSSWKNEETGNPTSLTEIAIQSDTFEDFLKNVKVEENEPYLKQKLETEYGRQLLHNIYENANKIKTNILGMQFNEKNLQFQEDILKAMENEEFAKMSAKSQRKYLEANISTSELTTTQKEAWNKTLDKIENEDIKNGLIVLAMLVNQMAGSWHMPNMSTYNTNNYVNQ